MKKRILLFVLLFVGLVQAVSVRGFLHSQDIKIILRNVENHTSNTLEIIGEFEGLEAALVSPGKTINLNYEIEMVDQIEGRLDNEAMRSDTFIVEGLPNPAAGVQVEMRFHVSVAVENDKIKTVQGELKTDPEWIVDKFDSEELDFSLYYVDLIIHQNIRDSFIRVTGERSISGSKI